MDKFDKLIDKHFGVIMSHKAASVQHYLETGNVSGTFRMSLRHMLSDVCGGETSEREQANEILPLVVPSTFDKGQLSEAWHHGAIRAPRNLRHLNNFDDYFNARYIK